MDLSQLAGFIDKNRKNFEREVRIKAKKLKLQNITKEIKLDTFESTQRNFKYGQRLDFPLCQGYYTISVDRNELMLFEKYNLEIARFSGHKVRKFYDRLSEQIIKAKEEENVDF